MTSSAKWLGLAVAGGVVLGALGYCWTRPNEPPSPENKVVLTQSDSLIATIETYRMQRDSLLSRAKQLELEASKRMTGLKPTRGFVTHIDSVLASKPLPTDSDAGGWKERAGLEKSRADSLQAVVTAQDQVIIDLGHSTLYYARLDSIADARIEVLESNEAKLNAALRKATQKRFRFAPCLTTAVGINPKREVNALAGAGFCLSRS